MAFLFFIFQGYIMSKSNITIINNLNYSSRPMSIWLPIHLHQTPGLHWLRWNILVGILNHKLTTARKIMHKQIMYLSLYPSKWVILERIIQLRKHWQKPRRNLGSHCSSPLDVDSVGCVLFNWISCRSMCGFTTRRRILCHHRKVPLLAPRKRLIESSGAASLVVIRCLKHGRH